MDSVFDRWGEGVVYVGIAWRLRRGWVRRRRRPRRGRAVARPSWSATPGRSRRASASPQGTGMAAVGLAPREVRIVILTIGLVAAGLVGGVAIVTDDLVLTDYWSAGDQSSPRSRPHHGPRAPSPLIQRILHVAPSTQPVRSTSEQQREQRRERHATATSRGKQDPRRDRRRRQLRQQPRPGPLLLRERQGGRLRPGADARQPRRLPHPRHRVRGRLRHRQEQGRQGPVRGDLHEAEQHLRLPAGPAHRRQGRARA